MATGVIFPEGSLDHGVEVGLGMLYWVQDQELAREEERLES